MIKNDKIVQTHAKGMVTIPADFRERLGIKEDTLLSAKLVKNGVLFVKIQYITGPQSSQPSAGEIYSNQQIKKWLNEDKLDARTAAKLKKLLEGK